MAACEWESGVGNGATDGPISSTSSHSVRVRRRIPAATAAMAAMTRPRTPSLRSVCFLRGAGGGAAATPAAAAAEFAACTIRGSRSSTIRSRAASTAGDTFSTAPSTLGAAASSPLARPFFTPGAIFATSGPTFAAVTAAADLAAASVAATAFSSWGTAFSHRSVAAWPAFVPAL